VRSFRHWTPRYIKNRLAEMYYHASCPNDPWLTRDANRILVSYVRPSDVALEFGSGRSTVWFAAHIKSLTSVEHDESWHKKVRQMLTEGSFHNVDYHLAPQDVDELQGGNSAYVRVMERFKSQTIDFVLVDGVYRDFCALRSLDIIRPGGMLIIDNVNWYLPHHSHSPGSRSPAQGPKGATWSEVYKCLANWRTIWTSSGVTDTAIFFKPHESQESVSDTRN
jgi:predicted O-methyltransferase YrrM